MSGGKAECQLSGVEGIEPPFLSPRFCGLGSQLDDGEPNGTLLCERPLVPASRQPYIRQSQCERSLLAAIASTTWFCVL